MNPGDVVTAIQPIPLVGRIVPAGTMGVVQWFDASQGRVTFAGFGVVSNVPVAWLRPARVIVEVQA